MTRSSSYEVRINRFIDEAKGFFNSEGEPLISSQYVLIREITFALERMWGMTIRDPMTDCDYIPEAYEVTLNALVTQALFARTHDVDAIYPISIWRHFRRKRSSAFLSNFWTGEFTFLDVSDEKFVDKMPVVKRDEAVAWLLSQDKKTTTGGRPKKPDCVPAYYESYPDGHEALGITWGEVERAIREKVGEWVSHKTIKRQLDQAKSDKTQDKTR